MAKRTKHCIICNKTIRQQNKSKLCQGHYLIINQMMKCKTKERTIKKCIEICKNNSKVFKGGILG